MISDPARRLAALGIGVPRILLPAPGIELTPWSVIACDQFTFLRFAHRTEVDPRPTLGENPTGVEWKARCNQWSVMGIAEAPNEGAGIWVRYLDPSQPDEFYGFSVAVVGSLQVSLQCKYSFRS